MGGGKAATSWNGTTLIGRFAAAYAKLDAWQLKHADTADIGDRIGRVIPRDVCCHLDCIHTHLLFRLTRFEARDGPSNWEARITR